MATDQPGTKATPNNLSPEQSAQTAKIDGQPAEERKPLASVPETPASLQATDNSTHVSAAFGGASPDGQAAEKFDKFMKETSGGFHATDDDWTTVGMDDKGFPCVKGAPEDVNEKKDAPERKAGSPAKVPSPAADSQTPKGPGEVASAPNLGFDTIQQTGTEAAAGGKTVTMQFPHDVTLTLSHTRQVKFPAGLQEVPEDLASNVFLKHNGARPYDPLKPNSAAPEALTVEQRAQQDELDRQRAELAELRKSLEAQKAALAANK